jgi:hypothetical protein
MKINKEYEMKRFEINEDEIKKLVKLVNGPVTEHHRIEIRDTFQNLIPIIPLGKRCAGCQTPNSCGGDERCLEEYIKSRLQSVPPIQPASTRMGLRTRSFVDEIRACHAEIADLRAALKPFFIQEKP